MIRIEKAELKDAGQLTEIGTETFIQSHGHSAAAEDIENYLLENYTVAAFEKELSDPNGNYYLLYAEERLVGYSKIIFNAPSPDVPNDRITKLERIYLLKSHHGRGLGEALLQFNIDLAKTNNQQGVWLYTWVENKRAIAFYQKMGF